MALFDVTGANLQITPFQLKQLVKLELTQRINDHA